MNKKSRKNGRASKTAKTKIQKVELLSLNVIWHPVSSSFKNPKVKFIVTCLANKCERIAALILTAAAPMANANLAPQIQNPQLRIQLKIVDPLLVVRHPNLTKLPLVNLLTKRLQIKPQLRNKLLLKMLKVPKSHQAVVHHRELAHLRIKIRNPQKSPHQKNLVLLLRNVNQIVLALLAAAHRLQVRVVVHLVVAAAAIVAQVVERK